MKEVYFCVKQSADDKTMPHTVDLDQNCTLRELNLVRLIQNLNLKFFTGFNDYADAHWKRPSHWTHTVCFRILIGQIQRRLQHRKALCTLEEIRLRVLCRMILHRTRNSADSGGRFISYPMKFTSIICALAVFGPALHPGW